MNADEASELLLTAETDAEPIEPLSDAWPELDGHMGMKVQRISLAERLRRGERLTGLKLGLTSRAKQLRMGIDTPITAYLTSAMSLRLSEPLDVGSLIHPRAEPEIVFHMASPLRGPGVTAAEALEAVAAVRCGVEIIDSRFVDFRFRLGDVVADNASAARYVLGPVVRGPSMIDLSLEACVVELNGRVVDSATGAAVQGHPAEALAAAASSSLRVDFTHLGSIVIQAVS